MTFLLRPSATAAGSSPNGCRASGAAAFAEPRRGCGGPFLTQPSGRSSCLMTLAGRPAANTPAGMSFVTTEFAPITDPSPMVTPGITQTFRQSQTLFPITTGPRYIFAPG